MTDNGNIYVISDHENPMAKWYVVHTYSGHEKESSYKSKAKSRISWSFR